MLSEPPRVGDRLLAQWRVIMPQAARWEPQYWRGARVQKMPSQPDVFVKAGTGSGKTLAG